MSLADRAAFADGYEFNPNDPSTFSNSTSITIFDDLGHPTLGNGSILSKTQAATAEDFSNEQNKYGYCVQ